MNLPRRSGPAMRSALFGAALLLAACGGQATSGDQNVHQGDHGATQPVQGQMCGGSAALKEYGAIMDRMHAPMMASMAEADPDVAFVKGMIPHHQGGVEMAEWILKYGKDPEIRALAQAIISAQNKEIAQMRAWLAAHPGQKP